MRKYFLVFERMGAQSQGCLGLKGSEGFGFVFGCLEFFGCLDISLGDLRNAVSRMAAPRGPVLDHRLFFSEREVQGPSADA